MTDVLNFPKKQPNLKVVPSFDPKEGQSPLQLLEHFIDMAKKDELVFLGVHAVRKDGFLMQAATGLMTPEICELGDPPFKAPNDDQA